jgi:hypothetical protein
MTHALTISVVLNVLLFFLGAIAFAAYVRVRQNFDFLQHNILEFLTRLRERENRAPQGFFRLEDFMGPLQ